MSLSHICFSESIVGMVCRGAQADEFGWGLGAVDAVGFIVCYKSILIMCSSPEYGSDNPRAGDEQTDGEVVEGGREVSGTNANVLVSRVRYQRQCYSRPIQRRIGLGAYCEKETANGPNGGKLVRPIWYNVGQNRLRNGPSYTMHDVCVRIWQYFEPMANTPCHGQISYGLGVVGSKQGLYTQ